MTTAERRYQRMDHINRKIRILRKQRADNPPHFIDDKDFMGPLDCINSTYNGRLDMWSYGRCLPSTYHNFIGGMNKGKIHCGCWMCSAKTKNRRNSRRGKAPIRNYKPSDKRKMDAFNDRLNEYYEAS